MQQITETIRSRTKIMPPKTHPAINNTFFQTLSTNGGDLLVKYGLLRVLKRSTAVLLSIAGFDITCTDDMVAVLL